MSLLPSATEMVFELGLGDQLRGVTFECDHPAAARALPRVSGTALTGGDSTPAQIDAEVTGLVAAGQPIYTLDVERIRRIDPDLILTQDLCQVCAVPAGAVDEALRVIGCHADVVALAPHRLDEVIDCIGRVGAATGANARAAQVMARCRDRIARVGDRVRGRPRPRVLVLEWSEPPFNAGHWVPDMVDAAGGTPVPATAGERSRRLEWPEIVGVDADTVLFMPCGFDLDAAVEQSEALLTRPELDGATRVFCVDANAYFSRPGPRLVDGVEILGELLHPTDPSASPPGAARVR